MGENKEYMGVMASAYKTPPCYKDKDGKELNRAVVVYVNMSDTLSRAHAHGIKSINS